mgnify:CR=1 FL=1
MTSIYRGKFFPSTVQESLLHQLKTTAYLSPEWWRLKEILESYQSK